MNNQDLKDEKFSQKKKNSNSGFSFKTLARCGTPGFPGPEGAAGALQGPLLWMGHVLPGQFAVTPTCQTSPPLSVSCLPPATCLSCSQRPQNYPLFLEQSFQGTQVIPALSSSLQFAGQSTPGKKAIKTYHQRIFTGMKVKLPRKMVGKQNHILIAVFLHLILVATRTSRKSNECSIC